MLNDGQWHWLEEIEQKTELGKNQIHQIVAFLKEYNFIISDETSKKIKLEETVQRFLTQTTTA